MNNVLARITKQLFLKQKVLQEVLKLQQNRKRRSFIQCGILCVLSVILFIFFLYGSLKENMNRFPIIAAWFWQLWQAPSDFCYMG